ncbi:uncharacterized protein RCO7_00864 [Rhynchosporium graminicola]|uniref:C2H2-type domain-containing protein n=1 Tax=Rhynchosporium graminicola TaxID=2792576 RepID=A0A1E1JQ83_9HELO|nr:uncharacterized protein RCO7_00864 [Rhynchosporium commune]
MTQQSNYLPFDPMFSEGSQANFFPGPPGQLGSSAMHRDLSSQSINSQSTGRSTWTDVTANSFGTSSYDFVEEDECMPHFKQDLSMAYDSYATYGEQFNGASSPITEQANSFGELSLDTCQPSSVHLYPRNLPSTAMSTAPRYYFPSFDDRSLDSGYSSSRNAHSMRRTADDTLRSYTPAYTASDIQRTFNNDLFEAKHTPTTLDWPKKTDLVEKYKLILLKENSYLEILNESEISYVTPAKVYLDIPESTQKGFVQCAWPGECARGSKPFTRSADLARHMQNVHGPQEGRNKFCCSYKTCINDRHLDKNAFSRKDHYRDHLRDYHNEDIGAAKGFKDAKNDKQKYAWAKAQKIWLTSRNISANHWRCARCLTKKWVSKHGWSCDECKLPCEQDRIEARMKLPPREDTQASMRSSTINGSSSRPRQYTWDPNCRARCDEGWFVSSSDEGEWDACRYCNSPAMQVGAKSFRS